MSSEGDYRTTGTLVVPSGLCLKVLVLHAWPVIHEATEHWDTKLGTQDRQASANLVVCGGACLWGPPTAPLNNNDNLALIHSEAAGVWHALIHKRLLIA